MLSIGKLVCGSENYYLRTVASGREEYYVGAGEAPGRWVGEGAASLGLSGQVGAAQLRVLLAGYAPDGERIGPQRSGGKRVAGFDLTFSAPKSVSLLWGLSEGSVSDAVRTAHDEAVIDALGYLERHALKARRGAGGQVRIDAGGVVGAVFRHRTSRAGDPQLHSHVLVTNTVLAEDGRWSAPDARLLYFHAKTAGFLYQCALRMRLVGSLGVSFGPVENGCAEVAGLDERMLRVFSSRRTAIEDALERRGLTSRRAAEVAALETRPAKDSGDRLPDRLSLHDRWRERALDLGFDLVGLDQALGTPRILRILEDRGGNLAERLLGANGLTERTSTFERRDVVRAVAEHFEEGAGVVEVEGLADRILERPDAVGLGVEGRSGEPLHTTTELLSIERRLIDEGVRRRHQGAAVVDRLVVDAAIAERSGLSDEQAALVHRLARSGDGIEVVVGKAGSGKTYALEAARAVWQQAGFDVSGTALAARAAAELQSATGTPSDTYASLVARLDRGERVLAAQSVLIVDEAGMLGTRAVARLVDAAGHAGAKLVLVGDHRQLPEIDAGGAFGGLVGRLQGAALRTNRRQAEPWERAALDELRSGDVTRALDAYERRGRLHLSDTAPGTTTALVADWFEARGAGRATMLAASRIEVEGLNRLARSELRRAGALGPDVVAGGGRSFALGDEVLCLRNDRRIGVRNGTRGVVVGASDADITLASEHGERLLPHRYLDEGWLTHSYATTIHKAQGATVDRAFVLATDALYREAGYVAFSRARTRTDLYVAHGVLGHARDLVEGRDPIEHVRRTLSESRAKRLASSYHPFDTAGWDFEPTLTRERSGREMGR